MGRLLAILLAAALPPMVAFAFAVAFAPAAVETLGTGTSLLVAALLTIAWTGIVALVTQRGPRQESRLLAQLAERGSRDDADWQSPALARVAEALDERDAQIGELARRARDASITEGGGAAAASVVATARVVMRDPTWSLAVLVSEDSSLLAPGVYGDSPAQPPEPLTEVHRWAATLAGLDGHRRARHAIGPWGAFMVLDALAGSRAHAVLLAPHEGRAEPSQGTLDLLTLVADHAATTLEHALLVHRISRQADELDRMARVQGDFLRAVSHDLQAPLASIGALAVELRASAAADGADELDQISFQADRLRRMVAQLLTLSRLDAGVLEPRVEVFRADLVVDRAWRALRATRPFSLERGGPDHLVVADPDRFEQVIWALLDNAVKYSPAGSPIAVRVIGEQAATGLVSRIEVEDHGAGMSETDRASALEPFHRSEQAKRLAPDGSGIGLTTARGLIDAMDGSLHLRSQLGRGTTAVIELPAESAASDVEHSPNL